VVAEQRLRNPFRNEADAFRLLLILGAGIVAVVVAALVGGAWLGVPMAAVLVAIAARASYRWLRASLAAGDWEVEGEEEPDRRRK
jgi:uncharacterized membrane protein YjjP (DUF1212 family)